MMRCYFNLVYWGIQYEDEEIEENNTRQVIYDIEWVDSLDDIMNMEENNELDDVSII
jgi:hypothetical protein